MLPFCSFTGIEHINGAIKNIMFSDGNKLDVKAMYVAIPFVQHSDIPASLGCELTEMGHIRVDPFQTTTVPGIYACGDSASMMRSVANAVSTGNLAEAMANNTITMEAFH